MEKKVKLNNSSIKKFNKLLDEVLAYYNLTDAILNGDIKLPSEIHIVSISALGLVKEDMTSAEVLFESVGENYPYLVPFFKVFKAHIFERIYQQYVSPVTFKEINWIIKKIREKNQRS